MLDKAVNRPTKPADYNAGHHDGENRESESVFLNAGEVFVKVLERTLFLIIVHFIVEFAFLLVHGDL